MRRAAMPTVVAAMVLAATAPAVLPLSQAPGPLEAARAGAAAPPVATTVVTVARDLGTLGGRDSYATAVDGDVVAGFSRVPGGRVHAFAYDLGAAVPRMIDLGTLGGARSLATDVSGDVVVGTSRTRRGTTRFFAYDLGAASPHMVNLHFGPDPGVEYGDAGPFVDGHTLVGQMDVGKEGPHAFALDLAAPSTAPRDLGTLGGQVSYAEAVDHGVVVGAASLRGDGTQHAFAYELDAASPRLIDLDRGGTSNSYAHAVSGGLVVGEAYRRVGGRAFVYDLRSPQPALSLLAVPPGSTSWATNVDGRTVVGGLDPPARQQRAFAYDLVAASPGPIDLGSLGGTSSATAIDGALVVGGAETAIGRHAFVHDLDASSLGMLDLGTVGGKESRAVDVSGGNIVGQAETASDHVHATAWSLAETAAPVLRLDTAVRTVNEGAGTVTVTLVRVGDSRPAVTVHYVVRRGVEDGAVPGADFTAGHGTRSFAPGETAQDITVPVVDDRQTERTESIAIVLSRPTGGAVLGTPQVEGIRIRPSDFRPDSMVRSAVQQRFRGDDAFNTTTAGQTSRMTARRGQSVVFQARVCNDPVLTGRHFRAWARFTLRAGPAARGARVRYFDRGVDVTAAMRSERGLRVRLRTDLCRELSVRVRVDHEAAVGSRHQGVVTATWRGDTVNVDRVRGVVRVVR